MPLYFKLKCYPMAFQYAEKKQNPVPKDITLRCRPGQFIERRGTFLSPGGLWVVKKIDTRGWV